MRLDRLDRRGLRALERAVRAGEPVHLATATSPRVPLDELVPLCHAVDDPSLARWLPPAARPGTGLRVSAVIPAARGRPLGLDALAAQDVAVEPVVLVNGPLAAAGTVAGVVVPWEGHGRTRMRGVALATAPYVLFTVDDALPLGAGFVRTLVEALETGGFDAVYARQLPWPGADPVTRARLRAWTPPGDRPVPRPGPDHVAALYRRDRLLADPLPDVPIGEDWAWGRGRRVGYVPTAAVVHHHPRRFRPLLARTRALHAALVRAGEPPAVPDLPALLGALPGVLGRDLPGAAGELLGQYLGARDARQRRK